MAQLAAMPRGRSRAVIQPITLEGFYSYFDVEDCLIFIGRALERAKLTPEDLPPYQLHLFRDLREPLDEEALAEMLSYWHFDLDKLYQRRREGWGLGKAPARPQIDVWVEITSKGNLKGEWLPRGAANNYMPPGTDFVWFERYTSRTAAYGGRPNNELFFLHDFQLAHSHIEQPSERPTSALDTPLLAACAKVVRRVKERLAYHFDVRMRTDVFVEWTADESVPPSNEWASSPQRVSKWTIEDPAKRHRLAELAELENLEERYGFSEQALLEIREELETRQKAKTGPPPSPHTLSERLAKEMKKRGLPATKGKVERALELIGRHRASPFSRGDNVVTLRRT